MPEALLCYNCGTPNNLPIGWRLYGDKDDTHYLKCRKCGRDIGVNNQTHDTPALVQREYTEVESALMKRKYVDSFIDDLIAKIGILEERINEFEAESTPSTEIIIRCPSCDTGPNEILYYPQRPMRNAWWRCKRCGTTFDVWGGKIRVTGKIGGNDEKEEKE